MCIRDSIEALESMNQRAGELAAVLAQAETERDFDRIKIEVQEVTTRLDVYKRQVYCCSDD